MRYAMTERQKNALTAMVLLLLTAWRILLVEWIDLPLFFDEAHYLHWSLALDWGYFSKPPMVALLIWLTTTVFGLEEWAVKLSSPLLYTATALLLWYMGRRWFSARAGRWAALLFATMPLVGFNSLFVTTDAPLLFFWALTLLLFQRALEQPQQYHRWLLAGLAGGLGLMSKYSMILLPASLLLWLLLQKDKRQELLRPGFWLAVATAFAVFLPNLWWNWQNDFISFQHTAEISQLDRQWFHPQRLVEFLLGQVVVAGPLTAWMGIRAWRNRRKLADHLQEKLSLAGWMAWPTWLLLGTLALLSRANLNWAAPATIGFALLAGAGWACLKYPARWITLSVLLNLSLLSLFYHWPTVLNALNIPPTAKIDPYHRIRGWQTLGEQAQALLRQYPGYMLAADNRKVMALLGYYTQPGNNHLAYYNARGDIRNQYAISHDLLGIYRQTGQERFLLFSKQAQPDGLHARFRSVRPLGSIASQPYPDMTLKLYVFALEGVREDLP